MTTEEIQLNPALEAAGIQAYETDLAELIIQLGQDQPSHIVVPALHKNRQQIREIFRREMNLPDLGDTAAGPGGCGAVVSAGEVSAGEDGGQRGELSDRGDGRRVHRGERGQWADVPDAAGDADHDGGDRKVIPRFRDLEVMLQLLPRSATGERMNPYNSIWTGVDCGTMGRGRFTWC